MKGSRRAGVRRHQYSWMLLLVSVTLAISSYVSQVASYPTGVIPINQWPTFPRRNIAALARDGYMRGFKRSISTLAKNGQLPTFRSPYGETDKEESDEDGSHEKRNMASIARLRSYAAMKRNIQALARDGHRMGRGQYNQQNDKRNVQSLARNGLIHKKDVSNDEEFFYPFYQPIPPQSDIDDPWMDSNEVYDLQQSVNPYMFPPLSQYTIRSADDAGEFMNDNDMVHPGLPMPNWYLKRGAAGGMPVHGLMRPTYVDPNVRTKRYILNLPEAIEHNDANESENEETDNSDKRSVDDENEVHDIYEKRHIGSLARLGLLPTFRYTGSRYSRSGRARLFMPSQPLYRKHPDDENFGIREYITAPKIESAAYTDDADVPPEAVSTNSHPTGRILHHRPLNNDLPSTPARPLPLPSRSFPLQNYDAFAKNRWLSTSKEFPKFYYFRSLKVPYHNSGKRYLTWPPVDNVLLRKSYPNSSLPSRRKNE